MSKTNIFVSYTQDDRPLAEKIFRELRPLPAQVWSAHELGAGDAWKQAVHKRLQESSYFLLVVTPSALDSSWVLQELGAAWALNKAIILVATDKRLVEQLPIQLGGAKTITFDEIHQLGEILKMGAPAAAAQP